MSNPKHAFPCTMCGNPTVSRSLHDVAFSKAARVISRRHRRVCSKCAFAFTTMETTDTSMQTLLEMKVYLRAVHKCLSAIIEEIDELSQDAHERAKLLEHGAP